MIGFAMAAQWHSCAPRRFSRFGGCDNAVQWHSSAPRRSEDRDNDSDRGSCVCSELLLISQDSGGATTLQVSTFKLIRNAAASVAASPTLSCGIMGYLYRRQLESVKEMFTNTCHSGFLKALGVGLDHPNLPKQEKTLNWFGEWEWGRVFKKQATTLPNQTKQKKHEIFGCP